MGPIGYFVSHPAGGLGHADTTIDQQVEHPRASFHYILGGLGYVTKLNFDIFDVCFHGVRISIRNHNPGN